jgi:glycine/D-amino acid oxidase-like deaminating enzyme
VKSILYAGRCGWMNAQQMGAHLLDCGRDAGVRRLKGSFLGADSDTSGRVCGVRFAVEGQAAQQVRCGAIVNCAGPYARRVSELLGTDAKLSAQIRNEIHAKAVLRDKINAVGPSAPMMIFEDAVRLGWSDEEMEDLLELGGFEATLVEALPGGAHMRPYPVGSETSVLLLWEALHADIEVAEPPPAWPELRDVFAECVLRGLQRMTPGLRSYLEDDALPAISVDGGYYTQVPDNLPLIGPLPGAPQGAYTCSALSGYGVMAANAAGELVASHVTRGALPVAYSDRFLPERWLSSEYCERVERGELQKGLQI